MLKLNFIQNLFKINNKQNIQIQTGIGYLAISTSFMNKVKPTSFGNSPKSNKNRLFHQQQQQQYDYGNQYQQQQQTYSYGHQPYQPYPEQYARDNMKTAPAGGFSHGNHQYQSKLLSQHSFNPQKHNSNQNSSSYAFRGTNTNIPELKKQMQQAISSPRRLNPQSPKQNKAKNNVVNYPKYSSQVSLLKSTISLPSVVEVSQYRDLSLELLQLQTDVMQEMLALKQDKITIMQTYNLVVGQRFDVERQLNRIKHNIQKQSKKNQSSQPNSSQKKKQLKNEVLIKNQELRNQYQALSGAKSPFSQRQQQLVVEIQNLQESTRRIRKQIQKFQDNVRPQSQRFQTFFPQKNSETIELAKARQARLSLYKRLCQHAAISPNQKSVLLNLIQQNQQLQAQCDRLENSGKPVSSGLFSLGIQYLRDRVKQQEDARQLFFQDLTRFKQQAEKIKEQNFQLKQRLKM